LRPFSVSSTQMPAASNTANVSTSANRPPRHSTRRRNHRGPNI
jgi:hypothetical protein